MSNNNAMDSVKNYDYKGFWTEYSENFKAGFTQMNKMVTDLFGFGKGYILVALLVLVGYFFRIVTTIVSTYFVTLYKRRMTMEMQNGAKE